MTPLRATAIDVAKFSCPFKKDFVPSIGSIIKTFFVVYLSVLFSASSDKKTIIWPSY
jgi:hypothetical protein